MPERSGFDVDFLLPLSLRAVLYTALGCVLGGSLGFGAGHLYVRSFQARAVIRVASVNPIGPVVPMNELRARAESRVTLRGLLAEMGEQDPVEASKRYRVQAEIDASSEGGVMVFTVSGSERERTVAVCGRITDSIVKLSHDAFVTAVREQRERKEQAQGLLDAPSRPGLPVVNPSTDRAALALQLDRLAEDGTVLRRSAERLTIQSRDAEVLDAADAQEVPSKKLLLAAMGAIAGMFLGLALARPSARG